jgi:hypothetical protein
VGSSHGCGPDGRHGDGCLRARARAARGQEGPIELKKVVEPDVDRGELQRYLSYVGYCPQMLVNNPSLEWSAVGPRTLRIRDREAADTWVDLDLREDGCPLVIHATRPWQSPSE